MQKIVTHLWFDSQAEEAANFYVPLFKNSKVEKLSHYGNAGAEVSGRPEGSVMTVAFELDGQKFLALNAGPMFKFTEAISLLVYCDNQEDIDSLWEGLSHGGEKSQCGWLKDKYGLSWQLSFKGFDDMITDKDPEKTERLMNAVLRMKKPDIAELKKAFDGTA